MNKTESYFIGLHIGDGSLYWAKKILVWELRGDITEKKIYDIEIKSVLETLFLDNFTTKKRSGGKNGCYGIQTTNKKISAFLLKHELLPGKKSHIVKVPKSIFLSNNSCKEAFIAGLFDTDGCICFKKINRSIHATYPVVEIGSASKNLITETVDLLKELGFRVTYWKDRKYYKLRIAGSTEVTRFFKIIAPRNVKHLNKWAFWISNGYYKPRSLSLV